MVLICLDWLLPFDLLSQAMDIVHPWTLDGSGKPLLPITTFSIAMIHRWVQLHCPLVLCVFPHELCWLLAVDRWGAWCKPKPCRYGSSILISLRSNSLSIYHNNWSMLVCTIHVLLLLLWLTGSTHWWQVALTSVLPQLEASALGQGVDHS